MLISEIKPINKFGKKLLEDKDANEIIRTIIEKPLQNACIKFKDKNIETSMSSSNRKNVLKKNKARVNKVDIIKKLNNHKSPTFLQAGKGYAWIMLNYLTLSDENKKILFDMEKELGEDSVWFVRSNYIDTLNAIRKPFRLKPIIKKYDDDNYNEQFINKQITLMYNHKYPLRSVFLRMPIDENTRDTDVEEYFNQITNRFVKQ